MLEACVEDFFHAMELGTPEVLHFFEADVQVTTKVAETSVVHENAYQHCDGGWDRS
jgi:hypothetical protein